VLCLTYDTPVSWIGRVSERLDEVLIDHAHCERKAAGSAMNMLFAYVELTDLVAPLREIVDEELDHLEQVLALLEARGIAFKRIKPSGYAGRLHALARKGEPERFVDLCLVAALIEARSCERFALMRDHLADAELAAFYGSLFESEARHYMTYVRLAERRADAEVVRARLAELAALEAEIVRNGDGLCRLHS